MYRVIGNLTNLLTKVAVDYTRHVSLRTREMGHPLLRVKHRHLDRHAAYFLLLSEHCSFPSIERDAVICEFCNREFAYVIAALSEYDLLR